VKTVLLFTPKYPPSSGGAAVFYSNLVDTQRGEADFLVVSEYLSGKEVISQRRGVPLYRVLPRITLIPRFVRAPLEALLLFAVAAYLIVARDVDLIHTHASSFAVIGLTAVATLFGVPLVPDCRDEGFRPWIVTTGPTPVWFSCASNIDDVLTEKGVHPERIVRLPVVNPGYVRDFRRSDRTGGVDDIVYVGSIREQKGVFVLLEVVELLRKKGTDISLTLIGDGPARDEVRERVRGMGLGDQVTLAGSLDHRDTLRRIAASDVLVLPSASEGLPRVVLEAQDIGTPVVATPVGAIPGVIDHENSGLLTDRSAESIASSIETLAEDDDLYHRIVTNGIHAADERGWEQVGTNLQDGYQRALELC
jgi:glycosyltransferase involved in cell wall biosynthesis